MCALESMVSRRCPHKFGVGMKALYITEIYPEHGLGVWDGGEKQFYEISRLVAKRGHEVEVLTCRFPGQPREESVDGVRVLRVGLTREPKTGGARREVLPVLSYILRTAMRAVTLNADLIHCNTYFPVYSGKIATRLRNTPLVTTFHDTYRLTDWISGQNSLLWALAGHVVTVIAARLSHHRIIAVSPQQRGIEIGLHGYRHELWGRSQWYLPDRPLTLERKEPFSRLELRLFIELGCLSLRCFVPQSGGG